MKYTKTKICLFSGGVLWMISGILLLLADKADGFAQWYSVTIYAALVNIIGRFFGMFSFSAAEILLYILLLLAGVMLIRLIRSLHKNENAGKELSCAAGYLFLLVSVLIFLFVINCGVNYQRDSFAKGTGMELSDYTVEELEYVCRILMKDVNRLAENVHRNEQDCMRLSLDEQAEAVLAMQRLAGKYPGLQGYFPQPKGLLIPWILSVQQISGIYSPFTIEANYNSGMTDYNIPFSACHELSHLRGFMKEEEANFIAYLACMESDSEEFQYSGSLLAWIYCTNALYREDYECWRSVRSELHELANKDLQENSAYWDKYEGTVAEIADKVNDNYLKANGQTEGIKSYGRMVDLMVSYYKELLYDRRNN